MLRSPKILAFVILFVIIIALGLASARRAARGSNDFDTFYYAGQAVLEGKGIYYTGEYYLGDKARAPFLYPPFAAIAFAPLALMPIRIAAFFWNLLCVGFFGGSIAFCGRLLNDEGRTDPIQNPVSKSKPGFKLLGKASATIVALLFLFALLIDNLTMAQVNLLVLFVTLASLCLVSGGRSFRGGMLMAAAIALKVTPLIFIPYFLVKRQWKALAGSIAGAVLFFLLLPTLVFGWNQNALLHRQWLGKSFKPALISIYSRIHPEIQHPFKKSVDEWQKIDLYNLLTPKNQSLSAALMRLFLKDRNAYANNREPRILVAKRYEKLPVLFGGLPYETLKTVTGLTQAVLAIFMFALFFRRKGDTGEFRSVELGLLFLSMTLFSPLARSHQFIFWMLPLLLMAHAGHFPSLSRCARALHAILYAGIALYVLQALPYGKAAGMGMWANLALWMGLLRLQTTDKRQETAG